MRVPGKNEAEIWSTEKSFQIISKLARVVIICRQAEKILFSLISMIMKLFYLLLTAFLGFAQAKDFIANLNPAQSGCVSSTALGNGALPHGDRLVLEDSKACT